MKIFLSGQKSFGLETMLMLEKRDFRVVGVSAPQLDKQGRPDKLFAYADAVGFRIVTANNLRAENIPPGTDLIVCAHSHSFIGRKTREAAKFGAIGYHPSLLPRHRGRDAVRWTIKMHDAITGGTIFWLNDRIDGGDIAAQQWCFVDPQDTASSLWRQKLYPLGIALLNKVLTDISENRFVHIKQDERVATFEPAMNPPPLHRPELIQLGDGRKLDTYSQVIGDFAETLRIYSPDSVFKS